MDAAVNRSQHTAVRRVDLPPAPLTRAGPGPSFNLRMARRAKDRPMFRFRTASLFSLFALGVAACGGDKQANAADSASAGALPTVIRVSAIPDDNKTKVADTNEKLCAYLKAKTGIEVRFESSSDYTACVNGLLANKLDLVWLGGVTTVEADDAAKGQAVFVATRDIDLVFKTYFIANEKALAAGKIKKVDKLQDLKPMLKDLTFTFGSKKSTSGHIMPRHFMVQAGIDPEQDLKGSAAYRASGGHGATLQAVASGEVDFGALNYSSYDNAAADLKQKAPIVYTTPTYVDYCWIGHQRLGTATLDKLKTAMLALDPKIPDQKQILDAWGAGRFVAADKKQWDGIRSVLKALPKDFLK